MKPSPRSVATLLSVAQTAGVHVSTASRALNPTTAHLVADALAVRIRAVASAQGYRRNPIAVSLRTRRSMMIGIVLPDLANPVFGPILSAIEAALAGHGYGALVANAGSDAREADVIEALTDRGVDGLVLATARRDDAALSRCLADGMAVVLVNRAEDRDRVPAVVPDDALGLAMATRHLIGLGHTSIAHVAGPQTLSTGRLRREGFIRTMLAAGLSAERIEAAPAYTREAGRAAVAQLLDASSLPTAIAASNDLLALGAYDVLKARGLRCPDDVSVTGHNDMPLVDMIDPPLTTVRIPQDAIGRLAADLVVRRIAEPGEPARRHTVAPHLITRRSTAPRRPA